MVRQYPGAAVYVRQQQIRRRDVIELHRDEGRTSRRQLLGSLLQRLKQRLRVVVLSATPHDYKATALRRSCRARDVTVVAVRLAAASVEVPRAGGSRGGS